MNDHGEDLDQKLQLEYRKSRPKIKRRTEKKVLTVDAFTVEERSRNFARKKKCKSTSHSSTEVWRRDYVNPRLRLQTIEGATAGYSPYSSHPAHHGGPFLQCERRVSVSYRYTAGFVLIVLVTSRALSVDIETAF